MPELPAPPSPILLMVLQGIMTGEGLDRRRGLRSAARRELEIAQQRLESVQSKPASELQRNEQNIVATDLASLLTQIQENWKLDASALPFVPKANISVHQEEGPSEPDSCCERNDVCACVFI